MGDRQSRQLEIRFPKGQGPEDNTLVQVVWEFLENGQKHPKCWARLPDVGCFKDWSLTNSYVCRAEWTGNDGDRCIQYIQRPNYLGMESDNHNGSLTTYAWANALFRYFTRRVYTEDKRRSWDISFGSARIRKITVDHYNQQVHFSAELGPGQGNPPSASRRSRQSMANEMEQLGLTGASADIWKNFPSGSRKYPGRERQVCDTCWEYHGDTRIRKCRQAEETNDCILCLTFFGKPCAWTDAALIRQDPRNERRRQALFMQPLHPKSVEQVNLDMYTYKPENSDEDEDEEDDYETD